MSFRCILVSFLETFIEISCHFYGFIKCFNVSLHLSLLYWNVAMIFEHILVWGFMVQYWWNDSWCGCIARKICNNDRWYIENWLICGKCLCKVTRLFMWNRGSLGDSPKIVIIMDKHRCLICTLVGLAVYHVWKDG